MLKGIGARPIIAFWGAFCATMGVNALTNATSLLSRYYNTPLSDISAATSLYLSAEIAALPLIPIFIKRFGAGRLLSASLWGFLVGTLLCAVSPSFTLLLIGRMVQGFFGGLLATTPLLLMKSDIIEKYRPKAMLAAGMASGFAPIVGPMLTSLLNNENVKFIFFIMAAISAACIFFLYRHSRQKENVTSNAPLKLSNMFNLFAFCAALACLVWSFEHMQQWGGWYSGLFLSHFFLGSITLFASAISLWKNNDSVLPLKIALKPHHTGILLSSFMVGVIIHGFLYLIPYFLIRVHDADTTNLFEITLFSAIPQLLWMPVVLLIRTRISPYLLLSIGSLIASVSVWLLIGIDAKFIGYDWLLPQSLRAIAIPMIVLPLGLLLIETPSEEDTPAFTSMYSIFRTLGGVISIAGLTIYTEFKHADYKALYSSHALSKEINQDAWLSAFSDTFTIIMCAMLLMAAYFTLSALTKAKKTENF
jgi:DHA2 family multidrug resistance protein